MCRPTPTPATSQNRAVVGEQAERVLERCGGEEKPPGTSFFASTNHAANFLHLHELMGSNFAFVILKIHHRWAGSVQRFQP
jgi:hypothetical protein